VTTLAGAVQGNGSVVISTGVYGSIPMADMRGVNPAIPGACPCAVSGADPVNTQTGDFDESSTDVSVLGFGVPLDFTRTYDASLAQSQASPGTPGPLGYGWSDNWDLSLDITPTGITVNQADGSQVQFLAPVNGSCASPYVGSGNPGTFCAGPYVTASLTYNSTSSIYTFTTHPYHSYTFTASGQLTGEAGPGGAATTITYNSPSPGAGSCPSSASSCETVSGASGRSLVIASNSAGLITSVIDPRGNAWTYSYCSPPSATCSADDLVSVADPKGNVTSYTYDQANNNPALVNDLLTVTKPNAQPGGPDAGDVFTNRYNSAGQVVSQTDPDGNKTTFDYSHMFVSGGNGYTLLTDPDGNQTQYSYTNGLLTSRTEGYGTASPSTWTYDPDTVTYLNDATSNPNNKTTRYSYDASGNVISTTNALGHTWTASYNAFDQPVCETLPLASQGCSSLSPPAAIAPGSSITPPASSPPAYVTYYEYDNAGTVVWSTAGDYSPGSNSASQSRTTYNLSTGESVTLGSSLDQPGWCCHAARLRHRRRRDLLGDTGRQPWQRDRTNDLRLQRRRRPDLRCRTRWEPGGRQHRELHHDQHVHRR
jgi:YD repeat-containing protein